MSFTQDHTAEEIKWEYFPPGSTTIRKDDWCEIPDSLTGSRIGMSWSKSADDQRDPNDGFDRWRRIGQSNTSWLRRVPLIDWEEMAKAYAAEAEALQKEIIKLTGIDPAEIEGKKLAAKISEEDKAHFRALHMPASQ